MSKEEKVINKSFHNTSPEKLTYPAILLLLAKIEAHGYDIIQRLNQLEYIEGELETATVYRILRRMEQDKIIVSRWEHGEFGPARRKYQITQSGLQLLDNWVASIQTRKRQIELFLNSYKEYIIIKND
ncbi:transcriptional regulator, PadR-like family [Desulfofarcimen acetoxidans DSM 771]|uniref:Transcriptional regulator, PadR-like family n=1 Tax=Desulfofarcimen acetoxidans (strain ATCC 49208 / DSM 771 / KCTC 5769 / VKM B-1644 / 5575) TaxID=485916 RepID=C8W3A2_DESAS|nr:helix-turn-helix transcriptional regulator [Desulfofarcimen acetoxidans]ACV61869.1 transcriptional regulator, PadR-like family [Desulfofarcimen acetoxidans DSM 771]